MQESKDEFSEVTSLPAWAVVSASHSPCLCLEVKSSSFVIFTSRMSVGTVWKEKTGLGKMLFVNITNKFCEKRLPYGLSGSVCTTGLILCNQQVVRK